MGYGIRLVNNLRERDVLPVPYEIVGSNQVLRTDDVDDYDSVMAYTHITGNYTKIYNFRDLYGLTGEQSIVPLTELLKQLTDEPPSENYYEATDGNVRFLAQGLLGWAQDQPTGIWETLG